MPAVSRKRPTIDDVARLAGVSIKTVSRVLNNEPNVRPATRERVLGAAAELEYSPNLSARRLAANRAFVIAMLYDNPKAPDYVAEIQDGALRACRARGYDLLIHPCDARSPTLVDEVLGLPQPGDGRRLRRPAALVRPRGAEPGARQPRDSRRAGVTTGLSRAAMDLGRRREGRR